VQTPENWLICFLTRVGWGDFVCLLPNCGACWDLKIFIDAQAISSFSGDSSGEPPKVERGIDLDDVSIATNDGWPV